MSIAVIQGKKADPASDIIIISDASLSSLKRYGLTSEEIGYADVKFAEKEERRDLVVINQYKRFVYIVRPSGTGYSDKEKCRIAGSRIAGHLKSSRTKTVQLADEGADGTAGLAVLEGLMLASYDFTRYFSKPRKQYLQTAVYFGNASKASIDLLVNTVTGTCITRDLVNEPVSYLTATQLSLEIAKVAKDAGFRFEYFTKKKIESLKMGGLLGVNQGSSEPPTFNILEWKPAKAKNKKPLIFVGKGVVYDTGGSSLKTSIGMEKMKGDMAGAGAVIGAMYAIAKSKLPYHVIGLIPSTDNRLDNEALVPGDVITMYSGKTVEVLNTDAEGRLILGDALHYADKYKPELVIDLATLTGAAVAAIGEFGMVSMEKNAGDAYAALEQAGMEVYERLVKFPLWDEYEDLIKSSVADIKNIGGPLGGAITAGKFLEHFVNYPWIHIDLSNALLDKPSHYRTVGGSGSGARLLVEFVKKRAGL